MKLNLVWCRASTGLWSALLVAGFLGGIAAAAEWIELGPAPILNGAYTGRVSALACSRTNPDLYYAGGADGGVWRSTDGGASWVVLTDRLPTTAIGALALDPTNESVIYAGSGEANYANHSRFGMGLYKSTDGGDTWQVLGGEVFAGRCFSRLLVHPQNPQRLYAAITRAGGFPEMAAAKGHPGASGPVGVFRSDDGGVSWTHLTNGLPALCATDLAMDPANPNVLYAAIGRIFGAPDNGIYKSTDGGDSWVKLAGGLPTDSVGRISVAVAPSLPGRVYALVTRACDAAGGGAQMRGAYRSDDAGATWTQLTGLSNPQATYGWYLSIIGVDPTNPDLVFMGGVTYHRSDDGGLSWMDVTPPHVDMHAVAWDAAGRMVVGDDGGVHRSSDTGFSWESLNNGLGVIQCYAGLSTHSQHDFRLFVGTQDNGTLRRVEGGVWLQGLGGDGGWTQSHPTNPMIVFGEYQGSGNLYKSTNLGGSFSYSGSGINSGDRNCFLPPYLVDPNNPTRMLYATHRIYLSTNTGSSWSVLSGDLTGGGSAAIRSLAIAPSDSNIVYAATNDGRVLVSSNGGQNFTLIASGIPGWPRVMHQLFVHPNDPNTLYLAVGWFGVDQVRRTTDRGQTWQSLDGDLPDVPVNVLAVDVRGNLPVIYAGAENGVYRSVNDGRTWHRFGTGMPNTAVIDLVLEPARGRLLAATQGRGLWSIAVGLPGDLNNDGAVNAFDIDAFVLALTDPAGYEAQFPGVDPVLTGDLNGDNLLNSFDIDLFVEVLTGV
jgi:photosystem II stability/assembly factor-like uncharacterized protein